MCKSNPEFVNTVTSINNPVSHFSICSFLDNIGNFKSIPRDHMFKFNNLILANLNKEQYGNAQYNSSE